MRNELFYSTDQILQRLDYLEEEQRAIHGRLDELTPPSVKPEAPRMKQPPVPVDQHEIPISSQEFIKRFRQGERVEPTEKYSAWLNNARAEAEKLGLSFTYWEVPLIALWKAAVKHDIV